MQAKRRRFDILNSFYLNDLQLAARTAPDRDGTPLASYLSLGRFVEERHDLLKPNVKLIELTQPAQTPSGHWPFEAAHRLTLMQQCAVNLYCAAKSPLVTVNGPPGTGKTTLLKEIIAAAIVQRALKINKLQTPDEAFSSETFELAQQRQSLRVSPLREELTGGEIVVASSNNAAVENISVELPFTHGADWSSLRYLQPVMALLATVRGMEGTLRPWGLISAPLGNRKNRAAFAKACFFGPHESEEVRNERRRRRLTLTLFEWRKQVPDDAVSFVRAKALFRAAYARYEALLNALTGQNPTQGSMLLSDPATFDSLAAQGAVSWMTDEFNAARAELFKAALLQQEAWVRESRKLDAILAALGKLIQRPTGRDPAHTRALWQALFMVVPVISTTLASVSRMFGALPQGSLGHLLVDEAGQATPQSVVGALWRSKRALIIGDPLQVEPVVTVPEQLVRYLAETHGATAADGVFVIRHTFGLSTTVKAIPARLRTNL